MFLFLCNFVLFCGYSSCGFLQKTSLSDSSTFWPFDSLTFHGLPIDVFQPRHDPLGVVAIFQRIPAAFDQPTPETGIFVQHDHRTSKVLRTRGNQHFPAVLGLQLLGSFRGCHDRQPPGPRLQTLHRHACRVPGGYRHDTARREGIGTVFRSGMPFDPRRLVNRFGNTENMEPGARKNLVNSRPRLPDKTPDGITVGQPFPAGQDDHRRISLQ